MLRVDTKSGHGSGKPTSKTIEEITDVYSFLVRSLNLEYKKGRSRCVRTRCLEFLYTEVHKM